MPTLVRSYGTAPAATAGNVTISSVDTSGGDCLIFTASKGYQQGSPTTPTFNGSSTGVTSIGAVSTGTNGRVHAWYLLAPSGTANVVFGTSDYRAGAWTVQVWSGVDQVTPVATAATASGTSGTAPAVTCTTGATGDVIIDVVGVRCALNPTTGPMTGTSGGQTVIQNLDNGGTTATDHALGGSAYAAGSASVAMGWTLAASNRWAIMAFPLKAAATGGGRLVGGGLVNGAASRRLLAG